MHLLACSRPAPDFTFHLVSQVGLEPFPAPAPVPPPVTDERKKEILAGEGRLCNECIGYQWAGASPALPASAKVALKLFFCRVASPAQMMLLGSTRYHCAAVLRPPLLQMCA